MDNKNVENVLIPQTRKVVVGAEEFEVKPLVRAQYKTLIAVFAEAVMSMDLDIIKNLEDESNIGTLINIISESALTELYSVTIDKDRQWINNNMTINQEMELFQAIAEVNDLGRMIENFTRTLKALEVIRNKQKKKG